MTTSGWGGQTFIQSPPLSPTLDLTANSLLIKFRVDQWARIGGGVLLFASSDDSADMRTTRAEVHIAEDGSLFASDGEFVWVNVNPGDWTTPGGFSAPNLNSITRVGVGIVDHDTGPLKVNVQQVWTRPAPTATGTVLAFDDGFLSQYTNVKPYLDKYGMRAVAFPIHGNTSPGSGAGSYMGATELQALYDDGWDLSVHSDLTASHDSKNGFNDLSTTDGTATTLSSFEGELARAKMWLTSNGWTRGADFFAWPQGKFDATRLAIARKYFTLIRVYRPTLSTPDADTYPFVDGGRLRQLGVFGAASPDSVDAVNAALDAAWAAKKTVVLTFHNVIPGGGSRGVDYPLANFQSIIDHIAEVGYPVKTLSQVMVDGGMAVPEGAPIDPESAGDTGPTIPHP
ncbi:polysaccharide deacetylase family protein [Mycolicibacterium sp.]|uniref:polysaccharide deacetylase family protein n=1 Tax=Mycolicibacterium sp. TaxID=2320850 RepID=UPI001A1FD0CF|nr:polysaccharide deacetylase family protein [Mycolicibacterium sp.]MBJ7336717.1 polysaccharide deacetylase family protein [Mycolicibacterium sp.]